MEKKNKMKCMVIAALATLSLLTACDANSTKTVNVATDGGASHEDGKGKNVVRKRLAVQGDFSYLTNIGSINIVYTQGEYGMEVEGDSAVLQHLKTSYDSNLLTVSMGTDGNSDINLYGNVSNATMYLSCPDLKCVSICGNGGFECRGTWRGDDLQVGVLGTGELKLDTVECNTFAMQSTTISVISIGALKARVADVMTRTNAVVDMNVDVEELTVLNDGRPKMTLTGKADNLMIKNPKDDNLVNKIIQ